MPMNHVGHPEHKSMSHQEKTHSGIKFAMGFAIGTLVGTLIGVYATQNIERGIASEKLSNVEDAMATMKKHTHSMGDAVRYTFRSIKKTVGKGSEKIIHEAEKGIEDIKKNL